MQMILFLIYCAAGYWAYGRVFEYNKVIIYSSWMQHAFKKMMWGFLLGFILIPVAIIRTIMRV